MDDSYGSENGGAFAHRLSGDAPRQIGHYQISAKLGEGGMGAVYRAMDAKLGREVAIKVLPADFAQDPDRIARFTREAKALASLNHPNIAGIYAVEDRAIIMELVEGDDLKGPLPLEAALRYSCQIADALEAAHEKGITHRDLKPANIKITPDGVVKLLDFGLAKASENGGVATNANPTISPTLSLEMTRAGMILGTAAYMSPEQASGKTVDKRADIWSFGVVLFEMLTGRRLFRGETVSETLADVLRGPLELEDLPAQTPLKLRELIRRCLDRNVRTRLRDIGEARVLLNDLRTGAPQSSAPAVAPIRANRWLAGLAALLALAIPAAWFLKPAPGGPLLQLEVATPLGVLMGPPGFGQVEVSPDGTMLVFGARDRDGIEKLWLRPLSAGASTAIPGTENGKLPYWSPDSRELVFTADSQLKRVELATLRVVNICDVTAEPWTVWTSRGLLLFANADRILNKVPVSGGNPSPIFPASVLPPGIAHTPQALPDGEHFLFQRAGSPSKMVFASISGKIIRMWDTNTSPSSPGAPIRFASLPGGGWLLSHRPDNRLVAHSFNPRTGELSGDERLIARDVPQGPSWSTSDNGVLAYRSLHGFNAIRKLTWVDRGGGRVESIAEAGDVSCPRISHDQKSIVYARDLGDRPVLFVYDSVHKTSARLTSASAANANAEWLPDDSGVVYASGSPIGSAVAVHRIGMAVDKALALPPGYLRAIPTGISPDAKRMAAGNLFAGANRLVIVSLEAGKISPLEEMPLHTIDGTFSPDGRWLLYSALVNGRWDVYVRPAQGGANSAEARGPWQISPSGGNQPAWRADGKEIFYIAANGMMTAVPVEVAGGDIRPGTPTALFPVGLPVLRSVAREYDVSADGKRFLLATPESGAPAEAPITVIVNWPKLLDKK